MDKTKVLVTVASLLLLLTLAANGIGNQESRQENDRISAVKSKNGVVFDHSAQKAHMVRINNIQNGKGIKNQLDTQQEITLIRHNKRDTSHYHHHEAAVDFIREPEAEELDQIMRDIKGRVIKKLNSIYIFHSEAMETPDMLKYFNQRTNIEYAEPNYILIQNELNVPNDVLYLENYQWNLPLIGTEQGWKITRGVEDVTIAVIDTGVDLEHPDLKNRIMKGINVLDEAAGPNDDNGHGTHVAGIIASETNNHEGGAGMTWFNKIMPVKAMGAEGYGTTFDIAKGIIWAVDHGADIINMSLGNYQPSRVLEEAVKYAYEKDVVMVSAAGNDGSDQPTFPSSYPEVLSVAAVDYDGKRASFSNFGDYIDISAPGVYIPSTYFKGEYAALSGTSMAAPHVAGLAALLKSANPDLSNKQIMDIIQTTAVDLGAQGKDTDYGNGLIDVNSALQHAQQETSQKMKKPGGLFWLLP